MLGARTNTTVRITDNDKGMSIEFPNYWAREDEGSVMVGVVRGDDGDFPVSVEIISSDTTAQAGSDYVGITNALTFATGEKVKLVSLPMLNDGATEANETFRLYLTNAAAGGVLGTPRTATVTVFDNDPGIGFWRNVVYAHEDQGGALLTVIRGNDQLLGPFQVEYTVTNLTTSAEDHGATDGVLEFAAGQMSQTLWIPIVQDALAEADERIQITLRNPSNGMGLAVVANIRATVTICDVTGMDANRFASVEKLPNGLMRLGLTASANKRFSPYYSLFPLGTSRDLISWEHVAFPGLSNAASWPVVSVDLEGTTEGQAFWRLARTNLIAPCMAPTGPYAVGKVYRLLTDPSRRNRFQISTNGTTMFCVWYPAVPAARQLPAPFEEESGASDPTWFGSSTWLDRAPRFVSYSFRDAPLLKTQAPYPILLYTHGGGGCSHNDCPEMAENLASHGYLVISVDHWDAWGFVWPDGTVFKRVGDVTLEAAGLPDRIRDLAFLLDQLPGFNQSDAILAGAFDFGRIAVAGWSWGGPTAGEFCRVDERCRAAISFDIGLSEHAPELVRLGLQKPSLMFNGPDNSSQTFFTKAISDAYWTQISDMTHNDFSSWYWWNTPGGVPSRREAWQAMHACILSFLDRYLKGQNDGLLDGNPSTKYRRLVNFKRK